MDQGKKVKEADFLKLFLKHENALRVFARSLLPSWRNVDDIVQEASIVMWEKLDQLDGEDGFFPWGKTIIRFKCMNLMQKKKSERLVFSENLLNLIADDAEKIDEKEYAQEIAESESTILEEETDGTTQEDDVTVEVEENSE